MDINELLSDLENLVGEQYISNQLEFIYLYNSIFFSNDWFLKKSLKHSYFEIRN